MGTTIDSVQRAIDESMIKHPESDEEEEYGINQNARAHLAAQAKLANEQREKHRASGGITGLVYSDESDTDDEEPGQSLTGKATMLNGNTQPLSASPRATSISSANEVPNEPIKVNPAVDSSSRSLSNAPSGLEPSLPIPPTPPTRNETNGIAAKPPAAWTVDEVVAWAATKGFDEQVKAAFRGEQASRICADYRTRHHGRFAARARCESVKRVGYSPIWQTSAYRSGHI